MKTVTEQIFIFIIILLIPGGLCAQKNNQCIAVITELSGEAQLKKASEKDFSKVFWGTQVFQGDEIKTADKSEVKLLFSNSDLLSLGPNSFMKISGKDTPVTQPSGNIKKISSAALVDLSAFTSKTEEKRDAGALAGLRSSNPEQDIELIFPLNTFVKTDRPSFSWNTKRSFDTFIINLYNSKGLVWSKKVSENNIKYPESEKGLEFGESYFWNVEGEYLIETEKSDNHQFKILSTDQARMVLEKENLIRDSFRDDPECSSMHSVLGAYYINNGLLQDAINEFQIISNINIDAAMPHEILGSLYSEVGDKDKAIDELQKALTLTKTGDK